MKKQQRQKKVLIPSMYSANYSKSQNMSVGTVCIKRFKFACMTILSPETVPLILNGPLRICKCSLFQISPRMLSEIMAQNALNMQIEAAIYQKFSRERSPESFYQSGDTPSRALPLQWYSRCQCNFLCINPLQPPQKIALLPTPI